MLQRRTLIILLAALVSPVFASEPPLSTGLISVDSIRPITVLPLNSPPINGFVPQVVYGLTDKQDPSGNDNFASIPSTLPDGGNTLPFGSSPYYSTAIFDVGSQSDLFQYEDKQIFNFDSADREGDSTAQIEGASGTETTDISDPIGVYATGVQNASIINGKVSAPQSSFVGQWNTSVLTTQSAPSDLPNLIGSPMAAQYQTVISNSQTLRLTVNGQTLRTPQVSFQAQDTALPKNYIRLSLTVQSAAGTSADPTYFPSIENFDNFADNPSLPTFWGSFFANVNVSHTGGSVSNASFLLDTGSQVTVLSEDTAASVGFYSAGPNASTPDFYVSVSGVGGETENVPGFYLNSLSVITNGGPINWTHVPVIVLDLPNPATGSGYVPGILGTNLFTDRDLILNGDVSTPYLGISPLLTPQWNADSNGNWGEDSKWIMGVPDADVPDAPANFLSVITAPRTITVDADYTAGSITFNNSNRYTLAGPGTITLQNSTGAASIHVIAGSHTIAVPLSLATDTTITVDDSTSILTVAGNISAPAVTTTKTGPGTLVMGGSTNHFAALQIQQGKLQFLAGMSMPVRMSSLSISSGATLDVTNNAAIIDYTGSSPVLTLSADIAEGYDKGHWDQPGIISSAALANAATSIGIADNNDLGDGIFKNQPIFADDILIAYTWYGDANLDGEVNAADLLRISPTGTTWSTGDFNYDGVVNGDDYALFMLGNTAQTGSYPIPVPEPVLVPLAASLLLLRNRFPRRTN